MRLEHWTRRRSPFIAALHLAATVVACGGGGAGGGFITGSGGAEGSACSAAFNGEGCLYATVGVVSIGRRMRCEGDVWVLVQTCEAGTQCAEKVNAATPGKLVTVCEAVAGASDGAGADVLTHDVQSEHDAGAAPDDVSAPNDAQPEPACGDGACEPPESESTCATDCAPRAGPVCGDGTCAADDTENLLVCGEDCGRSVDFPCLLSDCQSAWDACEASAPCSDAFSCVGTNASDAGKQGCVTGLADAPRGLLNALAACLHAHDCVD